jgi:hypothetical protein
LYALPYHIFTLKIKAQEKDLKFARTVKEHTMAKEVIFYQEVIDDSGNWSIDDFLMYSYNPIGIAKGFDRIRDFINLYLNHGYELSITPICRDEDGKTTDLLFTLTGDFTILPPEEQKRRKTIEESFYDNR